MHMTRVDVGPGVEDRDDGLAQVLLGQVTELAGAGPVTEGAQSVGAVPLVASELLRRLHMAHPAAMAATSARSSSGSGLLRGRTSRRHRPREARAALTTVTWLAEPFAARSSSKRRICSQTFMAAG